MFVNLRKVPEHNSEDGNTLQVRNGVMLFTPSILRVVYASISQEINYYALKTLCLQDLQVEQIYQEVMIPPS